VGLVIAVKLISLAMRRKRTDYEPDRGDCFACARCFEYCPNELVRRGLPVPAAVMRQPSIVGTGAGRAQSTVASSGEAKVGI
jgi:ferredoxin